MMAIALIGAAVLALVLLVGDDDDSGAAETTSSAGLEPTLMSAEGLAEFAGTLDHPVYWAGKQEGARFEVTQVADGSVYVRYLDEDDEAGDPSDDYLTIGTYPVEDAVEVLSEGSAAAGAVLDESVDGTQLVALEEMPTSVYFADEEEGVQVEVYDPSAERALELAKNGDVEPVG